ncbi:MULTISPECIES: FtsB family cell division protein [Lactobacillaceae]|uniref:FtsB family cell division protein n=1 Tax=Lactobacillaceae TaxID=33958 RepID=UPI000C1B749F|nr:MULTISPECIES: septum formation initiator family protein [Lactobacillaceae]
MEVRRIKGSAFSVISAKSQVNKQISDRQSYVRSVHKRRLIVIGIVFAIICLYFGSQIISSHATYTKTNESISKTSDNLRSQRETNKDLKIEVKQLNNKSYLEKYIRDKYMYTKDGELVYNLPEDATSNIDK